MTRPDQLTRGQQEAFDLVYCLTGSLWAGGDFCIINGYAGTGKTTLLGILQEELGRGLIVAPTGKAALRVKEATGYSAKTIHSWLYQPLVNHRSGQVDFARKQPDDIEVPSNRLVYIEEASMVSKEIWEDIQAMADCLDFRVVVIGDEFQLPPVQKGGYEEEPFSLLQINAPAGKVNMTEVTRQALESPIIRACMDLRFGETNDALMKHGLPLVTDLTEAMLKTRKDDGVVLCHTNRTRHVLNRQVREALKLPDGELQLDEPILVLKNNYAVNLFNGEVGFFKDWIKGPFKACSCYDPYLRKEFKSAFGKAQVLGWDGTLRETILSLDQIFGQLEEHGLNVGFPRGARSIFNDETSFLYANLGYVLTTHKAQGSEWPSVLVVIEESIDIHSTDGRRWLYTALSRAQDRVTLHYY